MKNLFASSPSAHISSPSSNIIIFLISFLYRQRLKDIFFLENEKNKKQTWKTTKLQNNSFFLIKKASIYENNAQTMTSLLPTTETGPTIPQDPLETIQIYQQSIQSGIKKKLDQLISLQSSGLSGFSGLIRTTAPKEEEQNELQMAINWRNHVLNFQDQQGRTTLHLAAVEDTIFSNTTTTSNASSVIDASLMCQLLVDLGADASQTCGIGGAPILHYSVTTGNAGSCAVVNVLLNAGASALTIYENISALEMAAGAAASMVDANDSGEGTDSTQSTMEITLDIVKVLLKHARKEAATVPRPSDNEIENTNTNTDSSTATLSSVTTTTNSTTTTTTTNSSTSALPVPWWRTNKEICDLLYAIPSRADYSSILSIGKSLNQKLEETINGNYSSEGAAREWSTVVIVTVIFIS